MAWYELFWRNPDNIWYLLIHKRPVEEVVKFLQCHPGFDLQAQDPAFQLPLHYAASSSLSGHIAVLLENGANPLALSHKTSEKTFVVSAVKQKELHAVALYFFHDKKCLLDEALFNEIGKTRRADRWHYVKDIYNSAIIYYKAIDSAVEQEKVNHSSEAINFYQYAILELLKQRAFSQTYSIRNADGTKNVTRRHDILFKHYSKKIVVFQESILTCLEKLLKAPVIYCSYEECLEAAKKFIEYSRDMSLSTESIKNIKRSVAFLTQTWEKLSVSDLEKSTEHFKQIGSWYKSLGEQQDSATYLNFAAQNFAQAYNFVPTDELSKEIYQLYSELKDRAFKENSFDKARQYDLQLTEWQLKLGSSSSGEEQPDSGLRHRLCPS